MVPSSHTEWLSRQIPGARLRIVPGDGHLSALPAVAEDAMAWAVQTER